MSKRLISLLLMLCILSAFVPQVIAQDYSGKEPVTITFGGWGDYFLLQEQCRAFEKKYPWITVEVVKPIGTDWYAEDLTKLAATGEMPDVFNIENLQVALQNEWVLDISELFANDPESATYPEWMLEFCMANDKLYTLISCLYVNFVQMNLTLLDEYNIPTPGYDWTFDEWMNILRKTTVPGQSIGTDNLTWYMQWLPAQFGNEDLGWYSYNLETRRYEFGDEFIETINILKELFDERVSLYDTLDLDVGTTSATNTSEANTAVNSARYAYMQNNYGTTSNFWYKGLLGMNTNSSWALNWDTFFAGVYTGYEWDIYPFPVAQEGLESRTSMLNEFLSISAACKHPEEAYLLLKYMSYDLDGYEAKVNFMANYDKRNYMSQYPDVTATAFATTLYIYLMPPSTDPRALEIFRKINPKMDKPGLTQLFNNMNNGGYLNIVRTVPGYGEMVDSVNSAIVGEVFTGRKTASDIAKELETLANAELEKLRAEYGLR